MWVWCDKIIAMGATAFPGVAAPDGQSCPGQTARAAPVQMEKEYIELNVGPLEAKKKKLSNLCE